MDDVSGFQEIAVDMGEVHEVSVDLLSSMQESGIEFPVMLAAVVMSAGRLLAPRELQPSEEIQWIKDMFAFGSAYFTTGGRIN